MKTLNKIILILAVVSFISCEEELTELNVNPNGVDPSVVNPNLLLPTIITGTATPYLNRNFEGHYAGVMQYIQKSGWANPENNFDWVGAQGWGEWYGNLRNAQHLYDRAEAMGMEFQMGAAMVIRAFNFGFITDTWGDAPYTMAIKAIEGEQEYYFPAFDTQETIYRGIIAELKEANTLLSKSPGEYSGINPTADLLYGGDPAKWRKFANSLLLRYYMRLSDKLPEFAKAGIEEIMANPGTYPIFTANADDAALAYGGTSTNDSWPRNKTYEDTGESFERNQLAAGIRDVLMGYNDPRLGVWFNPVTVQIQVSEEYGGDVVVDGVRYLHPDYMEANNLAVYTPETWVADNAAGKALVDTNRFVGIPIAYNLSDGSSYNLNPMPIQGGSNVHASALADIYRLPNHPMLLARIISYAELCFILAEAAQKGWAVGSQQEWYEKGITASFSTWGVSNDLAAYMSQPGVVYDGSLEQIIEQKWIANWTVGHESWCDWRRTGYPELRWGTVGVRPNPPLRLEYDPNEASSNSQNYQDAISRLVQTPYAEQDGNDSAWSKIWLLQGTGKPY
jgi:hypothetical protein